MQGNSSGTPRMRIPGSDGRMMASPSATGGPPPMHRPPPPPPPPQTLGYYTTAAVQLFSNIVLLIRP